MASKNWAYGTAYSIMEHLSSMVIVTDSESIVQYVNPAFVNIIGMKAKEVVGRSLKEILECNAKYFDIENFAKSCLGAEKPWTKEYKGTLLNGEIYWIRIKAFSICPDNESEEYVVYTVDDITEQKRSQDELFAEKSRLEMIFKNASIGMIFLDRTLKIVDINDNGMKMLGRHLDDVADHSLCDIITTADSELTSESMGTNHSISCELGRHVADIFTGRSAKTDFEFKQSVKTRFGFESKWFKAKISTMILRGESFALVILEDITVRKQIASELIDNEKRLRLITDNMLDLITQVDQNGVVIYATPSHKTILGYFPEEVIGKPLMDYVLPEDRPQAIEQFKRRLTTGENFMTEMRICKKDGSALWVEATGNVVMDDRYGTSILYVSRDTTIRKQAEYESMRAKEQAIEANRSKSQFLANMSHEIRTPLNGIIGMTNLTIMSDISDEQRENLVLVKNSAITLLNIINDILDFSKLEAGKVAIEKIRFNLSDVVQRVVKPLRIQAMEKNIILDVKIEDNVPEHVHGDPVRISQVLSNLVSNALKFTQKGGVMVSVKVNSTSGDKVSVDFSVKDTGIGISEDDLEKIFNSFSQADGSITRKYGGTGLGLSISKMLVGLMGGELLVKSRLGEGSDFHFTLPFKVAQTIMSINGMEEDIEYVPEVAYPLRVLVCEDEKINQKLFKRLLLKQGHNVELAENGIQAIEKLKSMAFDLILMDIQMPIMDGLSALSVIRNELKSDVPVIAITAYALKGDREKFLAAGMNEYISKPINIREFYEKIEKLGYGKENIPRDELFEKVLSAEKEQVVLNKENYTMPLYDIKLFLDQKDGELLEKTAHRIKELFEADGAVRLKRLAMKMELAARRQNMVEATQYYTEIMKLMDI